MRRGYYNFSSKHARIKILLEDLKEFYVSGDAISGKVILTVSDPSCSFNKVSVFIKCSEYCYFNGESRTHGRWIIDASGHFEGCIETLNSLHSGQHEFGFEARLDPETTIGLPPTFYDEFGEMRGTGVGWKLKAEAEYTTDGPEPKTRSISDTFPIEFHPTDITRPRVLETPTTLSADLPLARIRLPHCLPQRPTRFCVQVELKRKFARIDLIKMNLEKRVVTIKGLESTVKSGKILLAELRNVPVGIDREDITTSCQLSKREPAGFSTRSFSVQYFVHAEIHSNGSVSKCAVMVDVMPPVPEDLPE